MQANSRSLASKLKKFRTKQALFWPFPLAQIDGKKKLCLSFFPHTQPDRDICDDSCILISNNIQIPVFMLLRKHWQSEGEQQTVLGSLSQRR
jgi:hypothetical protein